MLGELLALIMNFLLPECQATLWIAVAGGAIMGTSMTILLLFVVLLHHPKFLNVSMMARWLMSPAKAYAEDQRLHLPKTIILIRHGESEANADETMWSRMPDNLL